MSWLTGYRRLNHRYERCPSGYLAFLGPAAALCYGKRLSRHAAQDTVLGRLGPLGVPLHPRRALDAQRFDHRPRRIERIERIVGEEPLDVAHRAHLEREDELVVRRAAPRFHSVSLARPRRVDTAHAEGDPRVGAY
ncbi:hypothetical protein GCM10020227_53770 [Streptomyces flavovirens]